MNIRGLSLHQMPPFAVPFRFFATAPVFGILVGLLLLLSPVEQVVFRWSGQVLAATHGLTLGVMVMVMFGALFQILPVVAGVALPGTERLALWVHLLLAGGTGCLMMGLALQADIALGAAVVLLSAAVAGFTGALVSRMLQMRNSATGWSIRLAVVSLLVTATLGVLMVLGKLLPEILPGYRLWTGMHLLWGFAGWTLLLIMGVSFQVIPMFYVTPAYPRWICLLIPPLLFFELVLYSLLAGSAAAGLLMAAGVATASVYAVYSLVLLLRRKRRSPDATVWFWITGLISFLAAAAVMLLDLSGLLMIEGRLGLFLAVVVIFGFVLSLIIGMLQKIVPFLVWLNLQQACIKHPSVRMPLSNMHQVIPRRLTQIQYLLHVATLAISMLAVSVAGPGGLVKAAALIMVLDFGLLGFNLLQARRLFVSLRARVQKESELAPESGGPPVRP